MSFGDLLVLAIMVLPVVLTFALAAGCGIGKHFCTSTRTVGAVITR